jgi:hypothetical protein
MDSAVQRQANLRSPRFERSRARLGNTIAALTVFCFALEGCGVGRAKVPIVEFTKIPAAGQGGADTHEFIEGRVRGAGPKQQLVIYAKSGKLWWVQPSARAPFTSLQPDSSWKTWTHRGMEYAALLVNPGYKPLSTVPELPEVLPDGTGPVAAKAILKGQSVGYVPPAPASIHFSGYEWEARQEPSNAGGKTNLFDPANAWTDERGFLHLRITQMAGQWICGEVRLKVSPGKGSYFFTVRDTSNLDPAVVLSINTWDELAVNQNHRDLGIEIGRWGEPADRNAQYVIQPYYEPSNVFRFMAPPGTLTWSFRWEPGRVAFGTARGSGAGNARTVAEHVFASGVPSPGGESVYMTLYVFHNSRIPLQRGAEVVIEKFEYLP